MAATVSVSSITDNKTAGTFGPGTVFTFTVNFGQSMTVTGTPTLTLNDGGTATYASGSGTSALLFTYTVGATGSSQNTADLTVTALTGTVVSSAGGKPVDTTGFPFNPTGLQVIDTTAPSETISSTITTDTGATGTISSAGLTKDNTLGLSGTVSDTNGVSSVQVFEGATLLGSATVSAGNWSFTTGALGDGSHSFTAKATDTAGNITTTSAGTATVDTTAPTISISSVAGDGVVNIAEASSGFSITGTATGADGQAATISIVDGSANLVASYTAIVSGGAWTVNVPPGDAGLLADAGAYTVKADVSDAAGNAAPEATQALAVDETAPGPATLKLDSIVSALEVDSASFTITGLDAGATAVASFTVGATTVYADPVTHDGIYSINLSSLSDGLITSSLSISDGADNTTIVAGNLGSLNTSDTISLGVGQFRTFGAVQLAGFTDITVRGQTAAITQTLTPAQIASLNLPGANVVITSDTHEFTFSVAQYAALVATGGVVTVKPTDTVTLRDTGSNIGGVDFSQLTANGIDAIDASDNKLSITVAQYQALGTVQLTATDTVTLKDDGANISALLPSDIGQLAAQGIDAIDATDDKLSLTVDQYKALGVVKLTAIDTVTLKDDGANISALLPTDIGQLAAKRIDVIDASNDALTLSTAQFLALGSVALSSGDVVTLRDTSAALTALTATQMRSLATKGVDFVSSSDSDDTLTLTKGQYQSLGSVSIAGDTTGIIYDTGASLAAFAASDMAAMAGKGVTRLDSSNDTLSLTVAQYQALGTVALTGSDVVTLADTNANLTGLNFGTLQAGGIDKINATDNTLTINLAQYGALGAGLALTNTDVVTLAASGAALSALSPTDIAALAGKGIDKLDATDNAITLSLAQFNALGTVVLSSNDALTLTGTSGNDGITFSRQPFNVADQIDGGAGADNLALGGDYGALVFNASTMVNVETLTLLAGHNYNLTLDDGNVAAGQTLKVNGSALGALNSLVFDGSAETDGKFNFFGGAGTNSFTGGSRGDSITAGNGVDTIHYTAASQSTSTNYDTITGFNAAFDQFDVGHHVAGVDSAVSGALSTSTFDTQLAAAVNASHLLANDAVLFTATSGTLSGQTFLVVDMNGTAGYQAGSDLAIKMAGTTGTIGTGNFS